MQALRWDVYCRVVDNLGDAGVCWRLAAGLAARGQQVRLVIDDAAPLAFMAPQGAPGVQVLGWPGPLDDSDVKVTTDGLIHFMVRLSASVKPLHQIPTDTSNLPPGSVEGALLLLIGAVQTIEDSIRVTMRIVVTETSEIVEASKGDSTGTTVEALTDAAQLAIGGLPSLNQ